MDACLNFFAQRPLHCPFFYTEVAGPAFEEFLDMLGQRVRLKGFDKYKGGLDNKGDTTGQFSLYTNYQQYEIMFHVSTMLPFTSNNRQQVQYQQFSSLRFNLFNVITSFFSFLEKGTSEMIL